MPARTLADSAKSLAHSDVLTIALSAPGSAGSPGEGIIGFSGSFTGRASRATTRLLDAQFPPYRTLLPTEWSSTAEVPVAPFVEAVKRVALVADRGTPVRLEFAEGGVGLTAGAEDEGRAEEASRSTTKASRSRRRSIRRSCWTGSGALPAPTARFMFTSPNKPVVLRPVSTGDASKLDGDYTYLIMPVRLPG